MNHHHFESQETMVRFLHETLQSIHPDQELARSDQYDIIRSFTFGNRMLSASLGTGWRQLFHKKHGEVWLDILSTGPDTEGPLVQELRSYLQDLHLNVTYDGPKGLHYLSFHSHLPERLELLLGNLGWVRDSEEGYYNATWRHGTASVNVEYDPNLLPKLCGPLKDPTHPETWRRLLGELRTQVDKYELLVRSGWGLDS